MPILGDAAPQNRPTYTILAQLPTNRPDTLVFEVWHEAFEGRRVQKMVDVSRMPSSVAFAEPRLLMELNGAGIVTVYDAQPDPHRPGWITYVMEYCEGGSVASALEDGHRFSICEARDVVVGALAGLRRLNDTFQYVHRDVKPGNLLLDASRSRGLLSDLGSAAKMDRTGHVASEGFTWGFLAPEGMPAGGRLSARSDVYAMGLTLFETVNGPIDWASVSIADLQARLSRGSRGLPDRHLAFEPHIPDVLRRLIRRSLRQEPGRRIASAHDLLTALRPLKLRVPLGAVSRRLRPADRGGRAPGGTPADAVHYRLDTPELADALAGRSTSDTEASGLGEQLEELSEVYGKRAITAPEWLAARGPIEKRISDCQGAAGAGHPDHRAARPGLGLTAAFAVGSAHPLPAGQHRPCHPQPRRHRPRHPRTPGPRSRARPATLAALASARWRRRRWPGMAARRSELVASVSRRACFACPVRLVSAAHCAPRPLRAR